MKGVFIAEAVYSHDHASGARIHRFPEKHLLQLCWYGLLQWARIDERRYDHRLENTQMSTE